MLTEYKQSSLANYIAMAVYTLMAIGAVFVFSASANLNQSNNLQRFYTTPAFRQIIFFPLALIIINLVSLIDYHKFKIKTKWYNSFVVFMLGFSIILLILVLIPKLGTEINYARRWFRIPLGPLSVSFQPSELSKWAVVIFLAAFCHKFKDSLHLYIKRFLPLCGVIGLVIVLVVIEDFGTAALIAILSFLIFIIAGVKLLHILTLALPALMVFLPALLLSATRRNRIAAFLNPEKWADTANYQANQSLIAIGSGGLWGKGLGRGICKYGHLPEDTTDFIFSIIGEELGFLGTSAVILLFIVFIWLGILVVVRSKDFLGQLLAGGIVLAIGIQAILNIAVVTVVMPTKGIPLPFVSAGGTSMLLSAAAVGILLNVAKQSTKDISGDSW